VTSENHNLDDDLQLAAFRYLHGEMSESELAAFEAQMGENPGLCEILAESVMLDSALRVSAPVRAKRSVSHRRLVNGAGVALLILIGLPALSLMNFNRPSKRTESELAVDAKTAALWVATASELATEVKEPSTELEATDMDHSDLDQSTEIPDWLFAVVAASEQDGMMDEMPQPTGETL